MLTLLCILSLQGVAFSLPSSHSLLSTIRRLTTVEKLPERHQTVIQRFQPTKIPKDLSPRFLQEEACDVATDVFDDDTVTLYLVSEANPVCSCQEATSFDFESYLEENPLDTVSAAEIQLWVDNFNEMASDLTYEEQGGCRNTCSICASADQCFYVSSDTTTVVNLGYAEPFTISDLTSLGEITDGELDAFLESRIVVFSTSNTDTSCYTPTTIPGVTSTLCSSLTLSIVPAQGVPFEQFEGISIFDPDVDIRIECAVTVDGEQCNSCEIDDDGAILDCANIESNPVVIDLCDENEESYPGIFAVLYDDPDVDDESFTLGSCDGTAPVSMPVEAPAMGPIQAPVTMPTETEAPAPMETEAPASTPTEVPVSTPTETPVMTPMDSAPTEAPMMAMASPSEAPVMGSTDAPVVAAQPTTNTLAPAVLPRDSSATGWNASMKLLWVALATIQAAILLH